MARLGWYSYNRKPRRDLAADAGSAPARPGLDQALYAACKNAVTSEKKRSGSSIQGLWPVFSKIDN